MYISIFVYSRIAKDTFLDPKVLDIILKKIEILIPTHYARPLTKLTASGIRTHSLIIDRKESVLQCAMAVSLG